MREGLLDAMLCATPRELAGYPVWQVIEYIEFEEDEDVQVSQGCGLNAVNCIVLVLIVIGCLCTINF